MDMPEAMEEEPVMEANMDSEPEQMEEPQQEPEPEVEEEPTQEVEPEIKEEPKQEPEPEVEEEVEEPKQEIKKESKPEPTAKQKAATKIVKNMGDKGRYEDSNQLKTLIVMQVLGNTKSFFETQVALQDTVGFFTDIILPDTQIEDNNLANYYMVVDSNNTFNDIIDSQYQ
jgi:outer membrane biosynthesis protein TonB